VLFGEHLTVHQHSFAEAGEVNQVIPSPPLMNSHSPKPHE
jgi:hypothetical protein